MSRYTEMQDVIFDWVKAETELADDRILWSDHNSAFPGAPSVSLKLTETLDDGSPARVSLSSGGQALYVGNQSMTLSIQYFGPSAYEALKNLANSSKKQTTRDLVGDYLVFVEVLQLGDISAIEGPNIEERAILDLNLRTENSFTDELGLIEHVEIDATVKNEKQETVIEDTIIIDKP